jgi:hypothetical protein
VCSITVQAVCCVWCLVYLVMVPGTVLYSTTVVLQYCKVLRDVLNCEWIMVACLSKVPCEYRAGGRGTTALEWVA